MAVIVRTRKGKQHALLNPAEKGKKFAAELTTNTSLTNFGEVKKYGLTNEQRAFRSGYLEARKDSAKAYNSRKRRKLLK